MGSQQSEEVKSPSQWEWAENQNGVEIYRNKLDGRLAERRRIVLPGNYTLSEENKVYSFRSSNPYGLVKSYQVIQIKDPKKQKEQIGDLCKCSNERIQLDVFTERISHRLSELPQLTFPQGLQVLKQTATAFEVAYHKVGGLHINPELIGITDKGEVRAWVNQNWALNHPSHFIPILKSSSNKDSFDAIIPQLRDQTEMINNLISVISQKTQNGQFPSPFAEQLKSKATNFRSVRKFLNEYVTASNINLPTIIKKDKVLNNHHYSFEPQFAKASSFIKSDSMSTFPQHQQPFQVPKFSFNSSLPQQPTLAHPISTKQDSYLPKFQYKPTSTYTSLYHPQPTLSFNSYPTQMPLSTISQIKDTVSTYKPFLTDSQAQRELFKPIFNDLKFNLLPQNQTTNKSVEVKTQPLSFNPGLISKPESPHFNLHQFTQSQEPTIHHNASYKILPGRENIQA